VKQSNFVQVSQLNSIEISTTFVSIVNDNGDAKFKSFTVLPSRAQTGSTIALDIVYVSTNGTGTGEMVIMIKTVDKVPLTSGFLLEAQKPGTYGERLTVDTTPDPECDPTRGKEYFN
jgi:hypothetical protein